MVPEANGGIGFIVEEEKLVAVPLLPNQFIASVGVMVGGAVHRLCGAKARPVIGIAHIGGAGTSFCQPVPIDPLHIPALAVIVANGVAANNRTGHRITGGIVGLALVGNLLPIVGSEQVVPLGIVVGRRCYLKDKWRLRSGGSRSYTRTFVTFCDTIRNTAIQPLSKM